MAEDVYYTVKSGDTLSEIAVRFNKTVSYLMSLNPKIKDPDVIYAGELIRINGDPDKEVVNASSQPKVTRFGLVSNTDNELYAQWTWDKTHTKEYRYMWEYDTGNGVWFSGSGDEGSTTKSKYATYSIPSNALKVRFKVKAISETYTTSNKTSESKEVSYWTSNWSTLRTYDTINAVNGKLPTPSAPNVTIEGYTLKVTLENIDGANIFGEATHVTFAIYRNDTKLFKSGMAAITQTKSVSYSCQVSLGSSYKVRCQLVRGSHESEWSPFSSSVGTAPSAPEPFDSWKAASETSVYLSWPPVANATSYELQYTTNKTYFDTAHDQLQSVTDIPQPKHEKTGLTSGVEYFFRVRAINESGSSDWNAPVSVIVGKKPAAPTTWSSTTTAISGEPVTLYWMHNAEDGSDQTYADVELYFNGVKEISGDIKGDTNSYSLTTHQFREGTKIEWRVRTAGITKEYGNWSVLRVIDVYAPPTLEIDLTTASGASTGVFTSFPIYVSALAGPKTQTPTGYHLEIIAEYGHETVDNIGNKKYINVGDSVYSKYFDTSEDLLVMLSPGDVNLNNNVTYTVKCTVSMDSGLTAESTRRFTVAWEDEQYEPNAEIGVMRDSYTTFICPYCENERGVLLRNITLSVYRRDYDGKFTEIATGLDNQHGIFVTDPHPALDFARYRIVAMSTETGAISYCDVSDFPIGCKEVIIQWDEDWTTYTTFNGDEQANPNWSGSMLKLPYNIDISDSNSPDVALVEYMGRQHPVSYYGTHLGETSTWNVAIPKSDTDTLSVLRRLSRWMGDVYVREPSGSGYWAHITVTFPLKHRDLTVPVSISLTRVEGGT